MVSTSRQKVAILKENGLKLLNQFDLESSNDIILALGCHGMKIYFVKSDGFTILDLELLEKSKTVDPSTG